MVSSESRQMRRRRSCGADERARGHDWSAYPSAAREARIRRRPARIPNPSLQPRDPDLATITRRPTLRSPPWAVLRLLRRRTRSGAGGVARCGRTARRPTYGHRMPFGGLAAPFRGPRSYGMRHALAALEAAWPAVYGGQMRRRRSCGADERARGHAWCACPSAAREARIRRRPARIPNSSLQPRHPDLATITRRPTLGLSPWAVPRQ